MGLPNALGMYADVKKIFDLVLAKGPATLTFETPSQAGHFRMRGYYFRKLLHAQQLANRGVAVGETITPYDSIKMTIEKSSPKNVRIYEVVLAAKVTLESGEAVDLSSIPSPEPVAQEPDELLLEAQRLAKDLGLD